MNVKAKWLDDFQERLWHYHTCDWHEGNSNPDYPFQLAVAYFDLGYDAEPEHDVEEAFSHYLETLNECKS